MKILPVAYALLLPGVIGCAASVKSGISAAMERPIANPATAGAVAARMSPFVAITSTRPGSVKAEYAPEIAADGRSSAGLRVFHRVNAEYAEAANSRTRPFVNVGLEYGTSTIADIRPSDSSLQARPASATLRSFRATINSGISRQISRQSQLSMNMSGDRSSGLGESASKLPVLNVFTTRFSAAQNLARSQFRSAHVSTVVRTDGSGSTTIQVEALSERRGNISSGISFAGTAGVVGTLRDDAMLVSGSRFAPVAGGKMSVLRDRNLVKVEMSISTSPQFDRVDGGVRRRVDSGGSLSIQLTPVFGIAAATQAGLDVSGAAPLRRLTSSELRTRIGSPHGWNADAGIRLYRQNDVTAGAKAKSDIRVFLGSTYLKRSR